MSDSLWPRGLQHARLPCSSPSPRACSNSYPASQWWPSNHLILCHLLLLLPSIFSSIRDFSSDSVLCIRWPKYWSFSFSISPSNEYSRLISFRIDLFDPRHSSLLQHHSSKASILRHSAFFIVHLSHPYMTTGKIIALTRLNFVDKPRQCIKEQRYHFAHRGPSSQSYGFSSGHVWLWELDHKKSWAPKNWCFWTGVLEKTLESPLDSNEIKPVSPKGNQPWIFTGRTDSEAEAPTL